MNQMEILLVDDEKYTLQLLEKIFRAEAYEIHSARSGMEALQLLETVHPDLIILDIIMPEMNGLEVLQKLKLNENTRYIPVIALTSRQDLDMKLTVLKDGALDYITKPFQKDELVYRVRNFLEYTQYAGTGNSQWDIFDKIFPDKSEWLSPKSSSECQFGYTFPQAAEALECSEIEVFGKLDQWVIDGLLAKQYYDSVLLCPACDHYNITMHDVCPHCYAGVERGGALHCRHCHSSIDEPVSQFKCLNCGKESQRTALRTKKIFSYKLVKNKADVEKNAVLDAVEESLLSKALEETGVSYIDENAFRQRVHKEIDRAKHGNYYLTVMSIRINNLSEITQKHGHPLSLKLMKTIVLVIKKFMRKFDVISFNSHQHIMLLLPQMHFNMAKILAEKIQSYFEKINQEVDLVLRLASYPEDGYDENEVLAMLDLGIEVLQERYMPS
ncbi:response regulator [candidate division KSB1 bacterium]|nr:response regulator [candidate division KSB1 bacterium]